MKKNIVLSLLMSAAFALSAPASASVYTFNWQWTGSELHAITEMDGTQIQTSNVGTSYNDIYGLWNGRIDNSFSSAFNFYNASNELVFTYAPSATAGNSYFSIPLMNAADGPLTALTGGSTLLATSVTQNLMTFTANGGTDSYTLQFQDLTGASAAVPEPTSLALLGLGLAGLLSSRRKLQRS